MAGHFAGGLDRRHHPAGVGRLFVDHFVQVGVDALEAELAAELARPVCVPADADGGQLDFSGMPPGIVSERGAVYVGGKRPGPHEHDLQHSISLRRPLSCGSSEQKGRLLLAPTALAKGPSVAKKTGPGGTPGMPDGTRGTPESIGGIRDSPTAPTAQLAHPASKQAAATPTPCLARALMSSQRV